MLLLYRLGIGIYAGLVQGVALFNHKASLFVKGRRNWERSLAEKLSTVPEDNRIWFHCASLGEFEQARPIIERIKKEYNYPVIISFFSPSGYEIRKNYAFADVVCYLPLDTKRNARKFTDLIKPSKAFFVKYEFWYYYLTTLAQQKISTYLVSAVFREDQVFFKSYGKRFYTLLQQFDTIFVQNDASLNLLHSKGIRNVLKAGDTRFDRVMQTYRQTEPDTIIERFTENHITLILGSSWPEEEQIAASFMTLSHHPGLRVIVAPHDISETHISAIEKRFSGYKPIRYTRAETEIFDNTLVLILDTIGHLASAYRYADIAFIGGAFGKGLHNILEPAVFGIPVIFGPAPDKFPEALQATESGFGFRINSAEDFSAVMQTLLSDNNAYEDSCKAAHDFVASRTGATDLIIASCFTR